MIGGDREAELTFLGASTGDALDGVGRSMVVDIGGGSTEFIVGAERRTALPHLDQTRRRTAERALARRATRRHQTKSRRCSTRPRRSSLEAVPVEFRRDIARAIGVAGTPTVLAAVDQELEPFDPWKVHGYPITIEAAERLLELLAGMPLEERRKVPGLHPDRAPTIVAGAAILLSTLRAFGLDEVVVSEHDILYGVALTLAA